jgi:cytochrome c-type biogenesis protein CcmH/NrfG
MSRFVFALLTTGVAVYALIDLVRSRADQVQRLPRLVWALIVIALPLLGGLAYLFLGRVTDKTPAPQRPGVLAPDDDPTFLATLEAKLKPRPDDDDPA